jgi:hypothetical protein
MLETDFLLKSNIQHPTSNIQDLEIAHRVPTIRRLSPHAA